MIDSKAIGREASDNVWPVKVSFKPTTAAISPAQISSISSLQNFMEPFRSINISLFSGPLGILFGTVIGWFAVIMFISRLNYLTKSILISGEGLGDLAITNIRRADRIAVLTLLAWAIITIAGFILLAVEFARYYVLRGRLKKETHTLWKDKRVFC